MLLLDSRRRVLSVTEPVARLLNTNPDAIVGRDFDDLRLELIGALGGLDDVIFRADVIPGIHLVMVRIPDGREDGR